MRVERIVLRNYRQFRQAAITFRKRPDTDLHFFIGRNGTGKTNLLNAINWCLYGDEPHLSKDSEQLPLINLKTVAGTDMGGDREVAVEVWAEDEQGASITFTRRANFRKHDDGQMAVLGTSFEVRFDDERGNTKRATDEDARTWVERFVPKGIREFFFFDGERLDSYFKDATGQKIRHAVFQISQIDLLEERIERKLREVFDDLGKEAGKTSPKIEDVRSRLEQAQESLDAIERDLRECDRQIAIARNKVAEYDDKLKDIPDVDDLEKQRQELDASFQETKNLLAAKQAEKKSLLLEYGNVLMLWPAIRKAAQVVEEKRRNQEIPPPVDKSFLEEVLRSETCSVCGRRLDPSSSKRVRELLQEMELSSEAAHRLMQMEAPFYQFRERRGKFGERVEAITREIQGYEKLLADITQRRNQIASKMAGFHKDQVREWYSKRELFEEARDQNLERRGDLLGRKQRKEDDVEELQKQLDVELKKDTKARGLARQIAFCDRALHVVRSTREAIMAETRERIERETKRQFFRLTWKQATFKDVQIREDYSIGLIHSMGYECLGSVSAGERELLALSFTLALHEASGFDSPILIDTPVARISDVNRENFAKVLSEVSTSKQILLLFTPDEHSKDISNILDGRANGKYSLGLTPDEYEAKVEVLRW